MSEGIYLDNDIVLKVSAYRAGRQLMQLATVGDTPPAILALARFTLRARIQRSKVLVDKAGAAATLDCILAQVQVLEPTPEEIEHAAELEQLAMEMNLSLDTGESQIVAMLIARNGAAFLTGDKRAAQAMSRVLPQFTRRVACFEQVLASIASTFGLEPLRSALCRERRSDTAATICFQCSADKVDLDSVLANLRSYSAALRMETGELLIGTDDLSGAIVPQKDGIGGF